MRRHGLALGSSQKANIINPVDPRAVSKQRKASVKEAKAHQQSTHNRQKREARLKEKLHSQGKVNVLLKEVRENAEQLSKGDRLPAG